MKRFLPMLLGIPFVGLVLASILIMHNSPDTGSSGGVILAWYSAHKTLTNVSGLLGTIGVIFGVVFFAYLWKVMQRQSPGLALAMFGGGLLFAASGVLSYGVDFAFTDTPSSGKIASIMSSATAQTLNYIQSDVTFGIESAALGVLFLAAGAWLWREYSGLARIWAGLTVLLGLAAASVILGFAAFIGIGVWVLVMSIAFTVMAGKPAALSAHSVLTEGKTHETSL